MLHSLSKRLSISLFKNIQKRQIITHFNKNYHEPSTNEELEEVKEWLNRTKPKFLCIFFTNDWNPVAKSANLNYEKFTSHPTPFKNLRVNTDTHPRLKWFFDNRCEPGCQLFYYGTKVTQIGGSNFEKVKKEMKRIQETIDSSGEYYERNLRTVEYEMPYYDYESKLSVYGNIINSDPYQTFDHMPFNPLLLNLKDLPFEEQWVAKRLKK
jgi:hypothetical protein